MRLTRAALLLFSCIAVLATACSLGDDGDRPSGNAGSPEVTEGPVVTDLPSMCEGFGDVPEQGEVTFVKGDLLFGVSPEGAGVRCITGVAGVNPVTWGPQGDFVIDVGFSASEVISDAGRVVVSGPGKSPRFHGISRPEGVNGLFIALDGTELAKVPMDGGKLDDISFLRRHDEAAYHPSGTQLAVTGENEKGIYGVWVVSNEGKEPHLVVPHRDEDEFYAASYSALGAALYYVDDQHSFFELRVAKLLGLKEGVALPKSELVVKKKNPMSPLLSPFTEGVLAYRVGTCDSGFTTFVREGSSTTEVGTELGETQPIGWLPDDRLVLASTKDLCDPERELDLYVVDGDQADLLVEGVTQAAVRAVLPPPEPPVSGPVGPAAE